MNTAAVLRTRSFPVGRGLLGAMKWLTGGASLGLLASAWAQGTPSPRSDGKRGTLQTAMRAATRDAVARQPAQTAPTGGDEASARSAATAAPEPRAGELDADTLAELRECQTTIVPGQPVVADTGSRPALVVGRRRVFDRVRGYMCIPSYAISKKPVTQAQYESVVGVRPHGADFAPDRPVFVSFIQAAHYCNTVSLKEKRTPCYEVRVDKNGKKTVAWPNRNACSGYRLPAIEEAAAYERGTDSEWTWAGSTLQLWQQLDARSDAPRGFYLARNADTPATSPASPKRHSRH